MCSSDCLLYILALLFPPLPVWVKRGLCSADSLINIALCCLGVLPGLLHAWYIIATTPDDYDQMHYHQHHDIEGQRRPLVQGDSRDDNVRYIYVMQGEGANRQQKKVLAPSAQRGAAEQPQRAGYGATQGPSGAAQDHGRSAENGMVVAPPAYNEAIKGDNKIQRS